MANRIGSYELIAELGSGAMGKVYRARDSRLDREVALKVLWPQLAEQPVAVARFEREARAVARLKHANVVAVFDIGAAEGHHYLAMEYVAGRNLRELLQQPLPVDKALYYFKQILAGLGVAHEHGVIHRDLKPGNILIEMATDTVKLADFGLARIVEEEISLTQSGELFGTVEYMAPELGRGEGASKQSDLYAAGVILYRLLTGRLPFQGVTALAVMKAHKCGAYLPATTVVAGLPPQADGIMARLLACEPANRYADCQMVFADIERWERGEEIPLEFAAAYEPIDHEIERHRVPGWKRGWARVVSWYRYQWLELFNRTELTVVRLRDEVGAAELELGKARRRLEEATLLRNRVRARADETRADEMEKEADRAEQVVVLARQEYASQAAVIALLRHDADMLLARRRRAKLEMSVLGVLPTFGRHWGERALAVTKLAGPIAVLAAGIWCFTARVPHIENQATSSERNIYATNARRYKNLVLYRRFDGEYSADKIWFANPSYVPGVHGKMLIIPDGGRLDFRLPGTILKEATVVALVGINNPEKPATFWQFDRGYPYAKLCPGRQANIQMDFAAAAGQNPPAWASDVDTGYLRNSEMLIAQSWGPEGLRIYRELSTGEVNWLCYLDKDQQSGIPLAPQDSGETGQSRTLYIGNDIDRQGGSVAIEWLAVFDRQLAKTEIMRLRRDVVKYLE